MFARAYTTSGGTLVEIGDELGCTEEQLEKAIGPKTAAVAYYVLQHPEERELSLENTVRIVRAQDVSVIVDAASRIWPLDYFKEMAQSGDLVCFGGKYFGACQTVGFVCGGIGSSVCFTLVPCRDVADHPKIAPSKAVHRRFAESGTSPGI